MPDTPPPLPEPAPPPAGRLFPCVNCGAKVAFDPATRSLTCPYCGHKEAVPDADADADVVERDFAAYLEKQEASAPPAAGLQSQVRCTGCGAAVMVEATVAADQCPFCGTQLANHPESVAGMIPPESLIPFTTDLRAARAAFDRWLAGLWFAPSALKSLANLGKLSGVYVPYWTYDAMTFTRYRGQRGDDYVVQVSYTEKDANGNAVTRTRPETRTAWSSVSGEVRHFFDDVLVCGSRTVAAKLVDGLEPWELGALEAYRVDFLGGFKAERYGVGLREGFEAAKRRMGPTIDGLVRRDIGGDHQRVEAASTRYLGVTFKHCLLPVWVAHYRFRDRVFHVLVNGRGGKVSGERPYSWVKIAAAVAAALLAVGLVMYAASRA